MKRPSKLLALLGAGLLLGAAVPGRAATVAVSVGTAAPTSYFASATQFDNGVQWRYDTANGRRDVGQSFLATGNLTLGSITFLIDNAAPVGAAAANAAFTLSLYQVASASAMPSAGTALLTEAGQLTTIVGGTSQEGDYVTFDFADTPLTSGNYYAVVLSFASQAANQNIIWEVGNTSAYAGGGSIASTDGSTFAAYNPGDLIFYATAAVPEPRAWGLLLGAGALLIFRVRRAQSV